MKAFIKSLFSIVIVMLLLMGAGGALNGIVGFVALQKGQEALLKLPKGPVSISYDTLKQDFCLFKVCLKAQNVQVQLKKLGLSVCLGDIILQKGLVGDYEISSVPYSSLSGEQKNQCVGLSGKISGNSRFWNISDLTVWQNTFKATFNGAVDTPSQMISLEGQTEGLADFLIQFIPNEFQFMAQLLLSNKVQNVSVRTDETHVKVFGLPVFPKRVIFNDLFKSISF